MLKITDEMQVFEKDVKCLSDDGAWAGGLCPYIRNIQTGSDIQTNCNVNSMKSFQDKVLFGEASGKMGIINKDGKDHSVTLHKNNICALACCKDRILTGSWDHSAILLIPTSEQTDVCIDGQFYTKKEFPHPQTVWKVLFLDVDTFMTACADKAIRIFKDGSLKMTIQAHSNVVRGICVVNDHIYGVDNYGKLLKITMDGQIVASRDLDEMCFDLCEYNGMIVICGEHGKVFVANLDLQILFKKKLPCGTCWCLKVVDGKLCVTGSDGAIYITEVTDEVVNENEEEDIEKIPDAKKKVKDSTFVSEGVKYKVENGRIYKEISGGWELIGDADGSYDHSFDVELGDKKYVLSFNDDENPNDVASRFINQNKLDSIHHKEIVDYINANFRKPTRFKRYEGINIDGISKLIPNHPVLQMVRDVSGGIKYSILKSASKNVYQIEDVLFDPQNKIPSFVILDICKYLWFKKIPIDPAFIFRHEYKDKKEAKAFVFLLTNMIEDPPFNLAKLDKKIKSLRDMGYLELNDVMNYDANCKIKK